MILDPIVSLIEGISITIQINIKTFSVEIVTIILTIVKTKNWKVCLNNEYI
jgi:hypothetical protein